MALPDLDPSDNTNAAAVMVNPQADLSLTKTVSDTNPGTDDEVQYTLTAHNAGPNDATGVTIHDSLPAGLNFLDASPGCDNQNGAVICDIGTLAAGDSASVTIDARTTAAISGTVVGNLATVSGNELDPTPANNQTAATITVRPLVDLELTKVASNPTPAAGEVGQLHADADQQRTKPRDRRHAHRPAAQRPLVPIRERRPGQLQRLRANRHLPARHACPGRNRNRDRDRPRRRIRRRRQRAEHRDRDAPTSRSPDPSC